jgi:hypothetical protein
MLFIKLIRLSSTCRQVGKKEITSISLLVIYDIFGNGRKTYQAFLQYTLV